jgi:hypothetical protein
MLRSLHTHKILWLVAALLSLVVAVAGVVEPDIYARVANSEIMPGIVSQDWATIVASLLLLVLALRTGDESAKSQIVILGILGYLFYAYGVYAIERIYTVLYLVYLAIFGLSLYAIAYGVASILPGARQGTTLGRTMRWLSVGFSLFIALMFNALWISNLLSLIQSGEKPEYLYSVYILDLTFIMPAFVITALLSARNEGLGLLLTPAMYVLGFGLLLPVGLGELLKPMYGSAPDPGGLSLYLGLSILFLILAVFHLRSLRTGQPAG